MSSSFVTKCCSSRPIITSSFVSTSTLAEEALPVCGGDGVRYACEELDDGVNDMPLVGAHKSVKIALGGAALVLESMQASVPMISRIRGDNRAEPP